MTPTEKHLREALSTLCDELERHADERCRCDSLGDCIEDLCELIEEGRAALSASPPRVLERVRFEIVTRDGRKSCNMPQWATESREGAEAWMKLGELSAGTWEIVPIFEYREETAADE